MAQKKPFVLRLDPEVLKAVEKWAADEFRSTNGQMEWIISRALRESGRHKSKKKRNNKLRNILYFSDSILKP